MLPTGDTSCYIIYNGQIFHYSASHHEAQLYADTTIRAKYGFKLGEKVFYVGDDMVVHDLNKNPRLNRSFTLVNDDNSSFENFLF